MWERLRNNYLEREYQEAETFDEYVERVGSQTVFAQTGLDTATRSLVRNHFRYRKISGSPEVFQNNFVRTCQEIATQYSQYVRVETTEIDPMVSLYMEREISKQGKTNGSLNRSSESSNDSNGYNDNSGSSTNTVNGVTFDFNKGLSGSLPDSATYSTGMPSQLNWKYTGAQQEAENQHRDDSKTTVLDEQSGSFSNVSTSRGSGNESREEENKQLDRERSAGRSEAPQDMLDRARNYILKTNAFLWLCDKLDVCFLEVFEI